ncbi:MAG TPA: type III pantothenate kinase [Gemmatimonadales bacterium]|nr:type III pantothenate kinase [Gemmatimonadales bacterium]
MLLVFDVGNTEITAGLYAAEALRAQWRLTTATQRTPDEWAAMITSLVAQAGHSTHEIKAAAEASVAPAVTEPLADGVRQAVGVRPELVTPLSKLPITLDVDEPMSVGADRIVNTLAACELFRRDTIVVDFGTATTFDCITADRRFIGGVIAPGLQTAAETLTRRAAKLPATELVPPDRVIGRRTEDCIRAGVLFGAAEAADGIVRRIKAEWPGGRAPLVVATGGLAPRVAGLTKEIERVEPELTLVGLRLAAKHLGLSW